MRDGSVVQKISDDDPDLKKVVEEFQNGMCGPLEIVPESPQVQAAKIEAAARVVAASWTADIDNWNDDSSRLIAAAKNFLIEKLR